MDVIRSRIPGVIASGPHNAGGLDMTILNGLRPPMTRAQAATLTAGSYGVRGLGMVQMLPHQGVAITSGGYNRYQVGPSMASRAPVRYSGYALGAEPPEPPGSSIKPLLAYVAIFGLVMWKFDLL
jgi:hypothetical protein